MSVLSYLGPPHVVDEVYKLPHDSVTYNNSLLKYDYMKLNNIRVIADNKYQRLFTHIFAKYAGTIN